MRIDALSVLVVLLTASACVGGMTPGTICPSGRKTLQFKIEKAQRANAVKAIDPSTRETLSERTMESWKESMKLRPRSFPDKAVCLRLQADINFILNRRRNRLLEGR